MIIYEELHLLPSLLKAHGSVMGIAFVILFPLGALLINVEWPRKNIWTHVAVQLVGWVLMLAGLGTGIKQGKILDRLHNNTHTILGTVVVVCLLFQPLFGLIHHLRFRKQQKRTMWTLIHTWYGRVFILLGIIDGGLGLRLANNTLAGEIVYGVIAGISGAAFIGLGIWSEKKKRKESSSNVEKSGGTMVTQEDGSSRHI